MFGRPSFQHSKAVDPNALPPLHEQSEQVVQGGLPGQHYHLSLALYQQLIDLITNGSPSLVPMMSKTGEYMVGYDGDLILTGKKYTVNITVSPSTPAPAPIPDVPSPPAPTPAPPPVVATDPYWNNVVALNFANTPSSAYATVPSVDQYGSNWSCSGADTAVHGNNVITIWGRNTTALNNPAASYIVRSFSDIDPRQYGGAAILTGDFTVEKWVYMVTGGSDLLTSQVGSSAGYSYGIQWTFDGNGVLNKYNSGYIVASIPFVRSLPLDTPIFLCFERKAGVLAFSINGVVKATMTATDGISGYQIFDYAHGYGPIRVTKGVARYNLANFTVPSTFLTA